MLLSVTLEGDGNLATFEVETDAPIENLKLLVEVEVWIEGLTQASYRMLT